MTDSSPHRDTVDHTPPRVKSELSARVLSALALAALALGSAWFGGTILALVWLVAAIAVLREWLALVGVGGRRLTVFWIFGSVSIASSAFAPALFGLYAYFMLIPSVVGGLVLGLATQISGGTKATWSSRRVNPVWVAIGPLYAGIVVLAPVWLRSREADGLVALVWLFLVVWISDIGAFFVGRTLGGPKLWPAISPKKTWSGLVGGLLFGTILSGGFVLADQMMLGPIFVSGWALIGLSLATSIVSELGDLFESAMKRHFGAKDSGQIIPGHGGIMDRLDSFIAAGIFAVLALDFLQL